MEIDDAKENIQPLSTGRNASILQATLHLESPQELLAQRQQLEQDIRGYSGDDPLEPWYNYVGWIEQSCPSGGKESGLEEVLKKCLLQFGNEQRYFQDARLIKLYNKFIAYHNSPLECYEQLFNAGIGTMVADFYISWAYYYDLAGNARKADEIFKRGIDCRAQPLEVLTEAHQHFGFIVAQRVLYDSDHDVKQTVNQQLQDRRFALTSLRGLRKKSVVGSIRTGAVVKSLRPGTVQSDAPTSSAQSNRVVPVFSDENKNPNVHAEPKPEPDEAAGASAMPETNVKSVVNAIIEAARNQENEKEPGPWNRAHDKKSHKLFSKEAKAKEIGFSIHEDTNESKDEIISIDAKDDNLKKPFIYPAKFHAKNKPQQAWDTPVTTENLPTACACPEYNKIMVYPRPNMDFQPEEWRAYKRLKRAGIHNDFVQSRDAVWCNGVTANARQYPNFAKKSEPQKLDALDAYFEPSCIKELKVAFSSVYNADVQTEFQIEELLVKKLQEAQNMTNMNLTDMEETVLTSSETVQRRKSFYPLRKSMAPRPHVATEGPPATQASIILETDETSPQRPSVVEPIARDDEAASCAIAEANGEEKRLSRGFAFEIFEDPTQTTAPVPPAATVKEDFKFAQPNAVASAYDGDETCSTQIFTNFLRAQSVSTPMAPQKPTTRMFGALLKDSTPKELREFVIAEDHEVVVAPDVDNERIVHMAASGELPASTSALASSATAASYSMLQAKQLSTILETSEHGTHTTTSGSTKSSLTSPVFETLDTPNVLTIVRTNELETLKEQSGELSKLSSANLPTVLDGDKAQTSLAHTTSPAIEKQLAAVVNVETPVNARHRVSFLEAGNFSRLENREDTGYLVGLPHFQTDKTETVSKILHASQHGHKFQDDKTDTFARVLLGQPAAFPKFQDDKTGTIPFVPFDAPSDPVNMDSFLIFNDTPPKVQRPDKKPDAFSPMQSSFATNKSHTGAIPKRLEHAAPENSFTAFLNQSVATTAPAADKLSAKSGAVAASHDLSIPPEFSFIEDTQPKPKIAQAIESAKKPAASLLFGGGATRQRDVSLEMFNKELVDPPYMQSFCSTKIAERNPIQSAKERIASPLLSMEQNALMNSINNSEGFSASQSKMEKSLVVANNSLKTFSDTMDFIPDTQAPAQASNAASKLMSDEKHQMSAASSSNIFTQRTPEIPKAMQGSWAEDFKLSLNLSDNSFIHNATDLDQTNQLIENIRLEPNVNPFENVLISAFLDQIDFTTYISQYPNCQLVRSVPRLQENSTVSINDAKFNVQKLIGSGTYGVIYSGKHLPSGERYAFKQEKPPNLWEYYICLEVKTRITVDDLLSSFMSIDYALIGNNASIYLTKYSPYGSLISVSNRVKKYTDKHIDEPIVMLLTCELLDIIDHLHALHIIHADVKADNFLLMRELSYPQKWNSLQLIDFGVSIDMQLFKAGQHFTYSNSDNAFKCVEMREGRPWTYQLDLYGLAGVVHVLLFAKHMEIEKLPNGNWMHKSYVPRYFNKDLWNDVFKTLLNVPGCNSQPNLQRLRTQIKEALLEKENILKQKVHDFNSALVSGD